MAQGEAPPDSSADLCIRLSLCNGGTSLSASACRSAAGPPQTCERSAPACCGLSSLGRASPDLPGEGSRVKNIDEN